MHPFLHFGPITLYTFGLCVGVGILLSYWAMSQYFRRTSVPANAFALFVTTIPFGLAIAHIDGLLAEPHGLAKVLHHPLSVLDADGFTYLGGLLAALALVIAIVWVKRWPMLRTLDGFFCIAPGYAIGRVGCFLSGDGDYGPPSTLPWAVAFPRGTVPTLQHVHPTMLYSAAWEALLFAVMYRLAFRRQRPLPPGTLMGFYLVGTSAGRFVIEFWSRNPPLLGGLTEAQLVSIVLASAGAVTALYALLGNASALAGATSAPLA